MNETQWDPLIFNFSHTARFALYITANPYAVVMDLQLASKKEGGAVRVIRGGALAAEVQIRPGCPKAPTSSLRLYTGDGSQAGLRAAVALVTYSDGARVSTDTSKISLFSFHPLSHFFPSLLCSLSFYPPFPLFIHSLSRTKTWPPARCLCHGCHSDRSLTAGGGAVEGEVRGKGNYGSLL